MYKGKRILCVIPARGGSKGVPGKNTRLLGGKPLIAYTIGHARSSKLLDRIIVSTDSVQIARMAKKFKAEVPFMRPASLATDSSKTIDVLLHAMDWMQTKEKYDFDILVLLHATTPFRIPEDIDAAVRLLVDKKADNVFSVTEAHRNPYFNMVERDTKGRAHIVKPGHYFTRQSAPKVFDMNASIYVWWKDVLKKRRSSFLKRTMVYEMPKERSVDIDDTFDFSIAEALMHIKK
jgi:CMP-N,N'-diacetyllegionaminic acid synthase